MDWLLVLGLFVPLLPGVAIGLLVRIWARTERSALLAELALACVLAAIAWVAFTPGYAVYALIWMVLGAQAAALIGRRRETA